MKLNQEQFDALYAILSYATHYHDSTVYKAFTCNIYETCNCETAKIIRFAMKTLNEMENQHDKGPSI